MGVLQTKRKKTNQCDTNEEQDAQDTTSHTQLSVVHLSLPGRQGATLIHTQHAHTLFYLHRICGTEHKNTT